MENYFEKIKNWLFKRKAIKKKITVEEVKEKENFITVFEKAVHQQANHNIWKTVDEIASLTGTTIPNTVKYVEDFDEFVRNSHNQYTTIGLYKEFTPFYKKVKDQLQNKID